MRKGFLGKVLLVLVLLFSLICVSAEIHAYAYSGTEEIGDISTGWNWPLPAENQRITSGFMALRNKGTSSQNYHQGIDIAATSGTPIRAARSGVVVAAAYNSSMGYYVSVRHGINNGKYIYTTYMHMNSQPSVTAGTSVDQNTVLGYVGSTGDSTGPHLHFHIFKNSSSSTQSYSPSHKTTQDMSSNYIDPTPNAVIRYGTAPAPVEESCNCSESYAGQYFVTTETLPLNMRSTHDTSKAKITTIPSGETITVTKGNGSWAHTTYNGYSGYVSMDYLDSIPAGAVDVIETTDSGKIHIAGWAYDAKEQNAKLQIHVYVGNTTETMHMYHFEAGNSSPDLGVPGEHRFDQWLDVPERGNTIVHVYAINVGEVNYNPRIGEGMVYVDSVPRGYVDIIESQPGKLHVAGWAYDENDLNAKLQIHMYVGNTTETMHMYHFEAGNSSPDLGVPGEHRFDQWFDIPERGNTIVHIYAINIGTLNWNPRIGETTVFVNNPTCAIVYDANGGWGGPGTQYVNVNEWASIQHEQPARDGHVFIGWSTDANAQEAEYWGGSAVIRDSDMRLYAVWRENGPGQQTIADGIYYIMSELGQNNILSIEGRATYAGGNIHLWDALGNQFDVFRVEYQGNGYYKITNYYSEKCLDVVGAGMQGGVNLQQCDDNGCAAQRWIIRDAGDGAFNIISMCNGLYIDAEGGIDANGTNVRMWYANTSNAEKWRFVGFRNYTTTELATAVYGGHTYKLYSAKDPNGRGIDWVNAEDWCEQNGGHLACITSQEENNALAAMLQGHAGGSWIGGNDHANEGTFTWVTGEPMTFTGWAAGQPDNFEGRQDYMHLYAEGFWDDSWFYEGTFICEYDYMECADLGDRFFANIVATENRFCLGLQGWWDVVAKPTDGNNDQMWFFERQADGGYRIMNCATRNYLDLRNFEDFDGGKIQTAEFNGMDAQEWYFCNNGAGAYYIRVKCSATRVIDVAWDYVQVWGRVNDENHLRQRFEVIPVNPSYVVNYDPNGGYGAPGQQAKGFDQTICLTTDQPARDGYVFIGWSTDQNAIEAEYVGGSAYSENASICLYAVWRENGPGQQTIADGDYYIVSELGKDYILSLCGAQKESGGNIHLWDAIGNQIDIFHVEYQGDGYYKITSSYSGNCLDVAWGEKNGGANLHQWEDNGLDNQRWIIRDAGNGSFNIISKCNGLYVDVEGGYEANGTNIRMWYGHEGIAEKWKFISYRGHSVTEIARTIYDGHTYKLYDAVDANGRGMEWEAAKDWCEQNGGHLACITTAGENNALAALLNGRVSYAWIGGNDRHNEGTFEWVTGEAMSYTSWWDGQPDDFEGHQDYIHLYPNGLWDDSWYSENTFICEYDYVDCVDLGSGNYSYMPDVPAGRIYARIHYIGTDKYLTNVDKAVVLKASSENNNQIWAMDRQQDGSYKIINAADGNLLDVKDTKTENGTDVGVWTDLGNLGQRWYICMEAGKYVLRPLNAPNSYLNADGTGNGSNIRIYDGSDNRHHFEIDLLEAPGECTVRVDEAGSRSKPTKISWTESAGATSYELFFYDGECWKSNCVKAITGLKGTVCEVQLTPGTYQIHLSARNYYPWIHSNVVEFTVAENVYTVSYKANGGTGAPASQTKVYGKSLTLSSKIPSKNFTLTYNANGGTAGSSKKVSAVFAGWNTKADGSGTGYTSGGIYKGNRNLTLYAQWTDPKAGTLMTPVRSGYTFSGWYTAASGGSKVSSSTVIQANTTLYAHWKKNPEILAHASAKNGSLKAGGKANYSFTAPSDGTYTFYTTGDTDTFGILYSDSSMKTKLKENNNSGSGGNFKMTQSMTKGEVIYLTVKGSDNTVAGSFTVAARKNYAVSYKANGGTGAPAAQVQLYGVSLKLASGVPSKTYALTYNANGGTVKSAEKKLNALFIGWNTKADGSGTAYQPGAAYKGNKVLNLYAQWTDSKAGTLTSPTRNGYTFAGWYTAASGGTKVTSSTIISGSQTLYAHWKKNVEVLPHAKAMSGSFAAGKKIVYSFTAPSDGTYTFYTTGNTDTYGTLYSDSTLKKKLTEDDESGSGCNFKLKQAMTKDQTVYLTVGGYDSSIAGAFTVVVRKNYTVTYKANGGNSAPSTQSKLYGTTLTLSSKQPTKSYTLTYNANGGTVGSSSKKVSAAFMGWNTKADGSGTSYQPGTAYKANAAVTLYAQWTNQKAGTLTTPTRSGYTFAGWYTAASGGTKVTSSTVISGSKTLYAHWTKNAALTVTVR